MRIEKIGLVGLAGLEVLTSIAWASFNGNWWFRFGEAVPDRFDDAVLVGAGPEPHFSHYRRVSGELACFLVDPSAVPGHGDFDVDGAQCDCGSLLGAGDRVDPALVVECVPG